MRGRSSPKNGGQAEARALGSDFRSSGDAEFSNLLGGASVGAVLAAVRSGQESQGETRELQAHYGVAADVVPWAMRGMETRVAATFTGDDAGMVGGFVTPPYPDSIAAFCGVRIVTPASGEQLWPVLTSQPTITRQTASGAVTETDGTIAVSTLTPRSRYQAGFSVRQQDLIVFDGAGQALSETLRLATRDAVDADLLNRAGRLASVRVGIGLDTVLRNLLAVQFNPSQHD